VDTAFTGELLLLRSAIELLELPQSSTISAGLADGKQVVLGAYTCFVQWFENELQVEAVECDGKLALLGIGLLRGRRLEIDYRERTLNIS
jgi:predicted aspartyl protease